MKAKQKEECLHKQGFQTWGLFVEWVEVIEAGTLAKWTISCANKKTQPVKEYDDAGFATQLLIPFVLCLSFQSVTVSFVPSKIREWHPVLDSKSWVIALNQQDWSSSQ